MDNNIILRLAIIEKTDTGVEQAVRTTALRFLPEVNHFIILLNVHYIYYEEKPLMFSKPRSSKFKGWLMDKLGGGVLVQFQATFSHLLIYLVKIFMVAYIEKF